LISDGSLFLTLPTRALTGQHNMPSDVGRVGGEQGFQARLVGRFLAEPFGHASGFSTTGIRLCSSAHNSLGFVV
jgi:hypothetical protein